MHASFFCVPSPHMIRQLGILEGFRDCSNFYAKPALPSPLLDGPMCAEVCRSRPGHAYAGPPMQPDTHLHPTCTHTRLHRHQHELTLSLQQRPCDVAVTLLPKLSHWRLHIQEAQGSLTHLRGSRRALAPAPISRHPPPALDPSLLPEQPTRSPRHQLLPSRRHRCCCSIAFCDGALLLLPASTGARLPA